MMTIITVIKSPGLHLIKHHEMKTYGGVKYGSRVLNLGTGWRTVVGFIFLSFYPRGYSPRYPLDRRLGGPQSRSGRYEDEKKTLAPIIIIIIM
jgi:hypothetical protein